MKSSKQSDMFRHFVLHNAESLMYGSHWNPAKPHFGAGKLTAIPLDYLNRAFLACRFKISQRQETLGRERDLALLRKFMFLRF
jgi:hypothetical protein